MFVLKMQMNIFLFISSHVDGSVSYNMSTQRYGAYLTTSEKGCEGSGGPCKMSSKSLLKEECSGWGHMECSLTSSDCVQLRCRCWKSQFCPHLSCSRPPAPIASALLQPLTVQLAPVPMPAEERRWNNGARGIGKGKLMSLSDTRVLYHFKQLVKLHFRAPDHQSAQIYA